MDVQSVTVNARATGGQGGANTIDQIGVYGGAGGTAMGGTAAINISQDQTGSIPMVMDLTAVGGDGGDAFNGAGDGANATGGQGTITINDADVALDSVSILVGATGGSGGSGTVSNLIASNGGDGGSATGGVARLEIVGPNSTVATQGAALNMRADATGGSGGFGSEGVVFGIDGGSGGYGSFGQGGTIEINTRTGAELQIDPTLPVSLSSAGTGGSGGDGGGGFYSNPGNGGGSGSGNGGTVRLLAQGGTISGGDIDITTTGEGRRGGAGGTYTGAPYGGGADGAEGSSGTGRGGNIVLETQDGSPGIITFDNVFAEAIGLNPGDGSSGTGIGGRVELNDNSTDPLGVITLGSLFVDATGSSAGGTGGFFSAGDSDVINLLGDLTINVAGDAEFNYDAGAQLVVGGNLDITTDQNLIVTHTNRAAGFNSFDVTGAITGIAANDITLTDARLNGTQIALQAAAGSLLGAGQLVSADDVGITVATDINADLIDAGAGQLTSFANVGGGNESLFTTPGNISVDNYITGVTTRFRVEADSNIDFGSITTPGADIQLIAAQGGTGDVFLGTNTDAGDIALEGENAGFTNLSATGNIASEISVLATSGDVSGGDANATNILDIEAIGGSVSVNDLSGGRNGLDVVATNDIDANDFFGTGRVDITAGGDLTFNLVSGFSSALGADNIIAGDIETRGIIGGTSNSVTITTTGDVTVDSINSTDSVSTNIGGTLTADSYVANSLTQVSAGAIDITAFQSSNSGTITATTGDISIDNLGSVGTTNNLIINSQNGDVNFCGCRCYQRFECSRR